MQSSFAVEGMHCRSCEAKVANALERLPGVSRAEVSVQQGRAQLQHEHALDLALLRGVLSEAGDYRISPLSAPEAPDAEPTTGVEDAPGESLYPLFLIVGFIAGVVGLIAYGQSNWDWATMMRHFMAGFFIVFAFFKLLDPPGFVSAYRGYDLLARRSKAWAWAYPYIELGLGVAYLLNGSPVVVNSVTLVLMLLGAAGVLKALMDKRAIRCACLGTALNLPMTKVTLVEDLTMAVMAAAMLVLHA
ncbi:MAG: cation transporter [Phycisphaeraceae bacterium]